ncbi:MAG: stage 0 sporulation family protein [Tissierellia bacterium]|nr:stage 0 sporulation family protein [Tissierellia bacterium]
MVEVVGIRFKKVGKIYYFSPTGFDLKLGDEVIVETIRGIEFGQVVILHRMIDEKSLSSELKPIIRIADELDRKIYQENKDRAKDAMDICHIKIKDHELDMQLVDCEYTFDGQKLIFYFIADGRIDFRDLVKDLAQIFKTRIELRQVGVRDKAKLISGLGQCGQQTCCSRHLAEFQPVSIKMAKDQGLSLNPSKISGVCGRLMCCLKYEEEVYESHLKKLPKLGANVLTSDGPGKVCDQMILEKKVKVKLDSEDGELVKVFKVEEIDIV